MTEVGRGGVKRREKNQFKYSRASLPSGFFRDHSPQAEDTVGKVLCWFICPHFPGASLYLCISPQWGVDSTFFFQFFYWLFFIVYLPSAQRNTNLLEENQEPCTCWKTVSLTLWFLCILKLSLNTLSILQDYHTTWLLSDTHPISIRYSSVSSYITIFMLLKKTLVFYIHSLHFK